MRWTVHAIFVGRSGAVFLDMFAVAHDTRACIELIVNGQGRGATAIRSNIPADQQRFHKRRDFVVDYKIIPGTM